MKQHEISDSSESPQFRCKIDAVNPPKLLVIIKPVISRERTGVNPGRAAQQDAGQYRVDVELRVPARA
ncbi:hypothetical protein [Aquabacterium sp. OR-4]|uniref:hypothetical protein n=1 Tax=Aquabacterium sp. OR-4 TaxID=2978127 RepID=UPI0021B40104|nr:hypothetical protein [Aquabacterium sp. OR-4]MDT7834795.1 hypothetical protein [Aquabacterium sp. OR-4]